MSEEERLAKNARVQRERYARRDVQAIEYKRRRSPEQRYAKTRYDVTHKSSGSKEFNLSIEEYKSIISARCSYCNSDISNEGGSGLDRVSNDRGFEVGNVNPCCTSCNRRRSRAMDADTFREQSKINGYWKET